MKKIITYGTFDLLHYGHLNLLKRARALGDYLVVGISSDEFNSLKGKQSKQSIEERLENLKLLRIVDKIIIENSWDQKELDIKEYSIDTFVIGDDWKGKFDHLAVEVVYLDRTKTISSTALRNMIDKK